MDAPETHENAMVRFVQDVVVKVTRDGVGPIIGSVPYAEARLSKGATEEQAIDRLITESVMASSTNGFVTGLGGLVTMPITLTANVAGALVINARLVGAIAHIRGYDIADPHVQSIITLTTAGGTLMSSLHGAGVQVGSKLTAQVIKAIPATAIRHINKRVGFTLLAKYGTQRSVITLAKAVPIAGGLVGAGVDAAFTTVIGRTAKANFPAHVG
ncbi:hypothetical protein AMIS_60300 [Actinoplanes missouriensis 431]|uniref:EcsC family protein n=1 Tax=Actinoplanes missouriensis (strain ATCC 14538 / DSM 43046 / CBS 188.64 / JCM 3121 / NBRC 102363 / NCIMB 12654 / NRRL B-3342 / UNCC 431) TaxID=512565 RepID=I0HE13_ACTM4|nr:EcsC family protein [Actinoplanes missouriensis]BAL91250.1 hypothetical protein AMIS_60300 [Actinoplanes missouriensis 431]